MHKLSGLGLALTAFFLWSPAARAEIECVMTDSGEEVCRDVIYRTDAISTMTDIRLLHWHPLRGATNYDVEVFDLRSLTALPDRTVSSNRLRLQKSSLYRVNVVAIDEMGNAIEQQSLVFYVPNSLPMPH